jgi:transcriptional regulator with XRE-family HTH domain
MSLDFQTALGEVIRTKRLANGMTLRSLSADGYLALGYLSELERGHKCPSSSVIDAIANGLGMESSDLIIQAGLLMANVPDTPESLFTQTQDWNRQFVPMR